MNDLVERLRDERNFDWNTSELEDRIALARSAADEIERLLAALADVIPLAGMANLRPESQAKLERAKRVLGNLE